jgi:hypothetical protein
MLKSLALAALIALPTGAYAQNVGLFVHERYVLPAAQIDATTFEIIENDGAGGTQIWCGAGIFVRKVLGERGGDIYISQARGPSQTMPGRKAVVFSTRPVPEAFKSVSQGVRHVGKTLSMAHAYALCRSGLSLSVRLRTADGALIRP